MSLFRLYSSQGNPAPYQTLFGTLRSPAVAPHLLPPLLRGLTAHAVAAAAGHPPTVALVNVALAIDHGTLAAAAAAAAGAAEGTPNGDGPAPGGAPASATAAVTADGVAAAAALALTLASASASYVEASALALAALLLLPFPAGGGVAPPAVSANGTTPALPAADPVTTAIALLLGLYPRTAADAVRRALGRRFPHHRRPAEVLGTASSGVLRLATLLGATPEAGGWTSSGLAADCVRLVAERAAAVDAETGGLSDLTLELLTAAGEAPPPVEPAVAVASPGEDDDGPAAPAPRPEVSDPLAEKLDALLLPLLHHGTTSAFAPPTTPPGTAAAAYDVLYTAWATTSSTAPPAAACHWALAAAAAARPGGAAATAARLRAVAADAAGAPAAARAAAVRMSAALVARGGSPAEVRSWLTAVVGWAHAYVAAVAVGRRGRGGGGGWGRGGAAGVGGGGNGGWVGGGSCRDGAAGAGAASAVDSRCGRPEPSSAKRRRLDSGGGGGGHDLFYNTVEGVALVLVRRGPTLGAEWVGRLRLGTVCASRLEPLGQLDPARRVAFTGTLARLGVYVPGGGVAGAGGAGLVAAAPPGVGDTVWPRFPLEVCGLRAVGGALRRRQLLREQQWGEGE